MAKCTRCNNTGVIDTGNNDFPCSCPAGRTAQFNVAGVNGLVTGEEVERHFFNGSPEPIEPTAEGIDAASLPRRD